MDAAEREVRDQLHALVDPTSFPVADPFELIPAMPGGPQTRVSVGERQYTAMELAVRLADYQDFPYESADRLVDDVVAAMREEGIFDD
ncbi:MTH865 family protein [Haloarchaeobius sp. DFWS5]|uniref:MTH865 family protein n=1 Tax=Haloarchaeobius sp. DFWS5 TaxID=3446114 RepID=UPI003EB69EB8